MDRIISYIIVYLFSSNIAFGLPCPEVLKKVASSDQSNVSTVYDELQKVDAQGKTKLALQSDFDDLIHVGGGGACASATAFNLLQGLRKMTGEEVLNPRTVLNEAFESIPVLLEGRVTNGQMNQLLVHFKKYLPDKDLKISTVSSPQYKNTPDGNNGTLVKHFDSSQFQLSPNEIKMVVYQVHNKEGKLLGRHFVILKRTEGDNQIVVVDPNAPSKEFKYQVTELSESNPEQPITRVSRADGKPHSLGWVFTMDTLLTVKLKNSTNEN